jgi:diguanylate cyclase (GGDEF)-like protein/PAS domain S-box-containing protein
MKSPVSGKLKLDINLMAGATAVIVAVAVPLVYFILGWQAESAALQTEGKAYALSAAQVLRAGPHSGLRRLEDTFDRQARGGAPERRRVVDASDRVVLENANMLDGPVIAHTTEITDADRVVGQIEVARSLRPLLWNTGLMMFPGVLLGWVVFLAVRGFSLRTLRLALQELDARKHTEARLQDSLSMLGATLESTADGILVTDATGRIVVFNRRYAEMWGIPHEIASTRDDNAALAVVMGQLTDPNGFLRKLRWLATHPDEENHDHLELKDGRMFEWYSQPQLLDGESVGRVASFHDISERKRAEALLAGEKRVLEMIVGGSALAEVLGILARNIEEQSGCMICSILFRDVHKPEGIRVAGPSLPDSYARTLAQDDAAIVPLENILGEHGQYGESPAVVKILGHPHWQDYQDLVQGSGLQAHWVAPVLSNSGRLLGAVITHYRAPFVPGPNDMELIDIATNLTGIAIERRESEARLHYLAYYDLLTGLPNRALFRDRLTQALARAERNKRLVGLMFLDLDRFKEINDTLGHDMGDHLLKTVAERLRSCMREEDTVARLGGDEFTVIVEGIEGPEGAALVAQKIIDVLAPPIKLAQHETFVSSSIGITVSPMDSTDLDQLLQNADTAMYRAKERGRNNYQFYRPEMNVTTLHHLQMETDLRYALERGEFLVYYQPKVELKTGAITGVEALLRWNHPGRGLVSPLEFIPMLEETGLITPVGEWLLSAACRQSRAWQEQGLAPLRMAVNLSPRQFQHDDLAGTVARVLQETGLEPGLLEFEVTESMLMHDPDNTAEILRQIKAMGVVRINIDDFGTGYSSFSYLKRFPISAVKLAQSFVQGLPDDEEDVAIVVAVIAMAHSLKLRVIAEGVERPGQLDFLREHGCDEIQGFICSPALPPAEFLELLERSQSDGCLPESGNVAFLSEARRLREDAGRSAT